MSDQTRESADPKRRGLFYDTRTQSRFLLSIAQGFVASLLAAFTLFTFLLVFGPGGSPTDRVTKDEIANRILAAIENDGGLRAVKHLYAIRKIERGDLFAVLFGGVRRKSDLHYRVSDSLAYILEDIRTEQILDKKFTKESLAKLDRVIAEHAAVNPFDALERSQKDYFDSIRQKTGEQYASIKSDIEKLVDELTKKNDLVQKYLADSTLSLRLTYLALALSLIIGGWQVFVSWPSRQRKLVREELRRQEP